MIKNVVWAGNVDDKNGVDVMSGTLSTSGGIRRLWPAETHVLRDHLLRLDKDSRRMRFAHGVSDSFIENYAARTNDMESVIYGYFEGGEARAVAELRKLAEGWVPEAEAAFSVERTYQDQGLGSDLMGRVIRAARNRGVHRLFMSCLAENGKMQAIARKYEADLRFEHGEVVGEIVPTGPNYFSIMSEAVDDRMSFIMAVLDLQHRLVKAA